jgi:hypothetical protein
MLTLCLGQGIARLYSDTLRQEGSRGFSDLGSISRNEGACSAGPESFACLPF